MSVEWKQGAGPQAVDSPFASNDIAPGRIHDPKLTSDLLSPHLYDLVVWGFTERNALGEWVRASGHPEPVDKHPVGDHGDFGSEESPLYVGFRCQSCWEAAVRRVAYGDYLCPRGREGGLDLSGINTE